MASNDREELEELLQLEALEQKAAGIPPTSAPSRVLDVSKLTDPYEVEFAQGRQGSLSDDEIQEAIRQYRSIKKADQEIPTQGYTKIPTIKAAPTTPPNIPSIAPTLSQSSEPNAPSIPPTEVNPYTPRTSFQDLLGPTGQSAVTSALAMGALTPGPLPLKLLGGLAGGAGALFAEEGTRRLQENLGEVPGYLAGLAMSILAGGGIGLAGRTPSHPTKVGGIRIESPETKPLTIPSVDELLIETTPRGGAYSTQELLTPPGSRISTEGQFSTGTGESLFGPLQRIDEPTPPPFGSKPITIPPSQPTRLWQMEGVPETRLQEKYPTIEQKVQGRTPPVEQKPAGIDMGSTGPSGEWVPPKEYTEPPLPSRWRQMWNAEKQRWGQEFPVLKNQPQSPVISGMEATHVYVEDFMEQYVKQPWLKQLMKFGDNTKLAPLEKKWIDMEKAGQDPNVGMPNDFKQMFGRMDALLEEENTINRRRGLAEIPKVQGRYAPRLTDEDYKLMRSVARSRDGAKTPQSIGSFEQARVIETLEEGLRKGITYKDWRTALLLREARGAALRATDILMTDLEKAGVIHRTKDAAEAVSLTRKAYAADGLPFSPPGGTWWVRSAEERQFLLQNMRQIEGGTLADIRGWAQQFLRNPSLVNPWPHIVKNMGLKQMQQAVAGGLRPDQVVKQSLVHRWGKPDMLEEFQRVMPFTKSGTTVWELIERTGPKTTIQQMSRVPGLLNAYASKEIFAKWDPAMRYGLWREYVRKGMTPQEAANHTWIDLIRYGTRADRIDAWNSVPFNFFVPWRVGTLRTMNKALQTAPVRFGLFMGAVDTIREMDYRYNGRWTHLPYDYIERPLMTLIQDGKAEALTTLGATIIAGPGGEYMFRSVQNILNEVQGKGGVGDLRTLVWGLAQVYDLWPQYTAWEKDHNPAHITDMLGLVLLGRHATPYGAPRRFGALIPENLIRTHPQVKDTELLREAVKEHSEATQLRKQARDIDKYQQPFSPQIPASK